MAEKIEQLREKANRLPLLPGVYIMLDESGEVIYVGKAKALKNRVSSYFRGEHEIKTSAMVSKVADFNVIVASSEFEALVLENSLIKQHQPHYNILLRDDKGFPFIKLDKSVEYPRFAIVNRQENDGAKYFGPYGGRGMTNEIIDTVCRALKLPTCSKRFPRDIGKSRPCLNHHMGTCAGYCLKDSSAEEYRASMRQAEMLLDGKTAQLRQELEEQMNEEAENLRFERAAEIRDRLRAISGLGNRQHVIAATGADTDAVGFFRGAKTCFSVLHYVGGNLAGKDYEIIDEPLESDEQAVSALIRQYYSQRRSCPRVIMLPLELEDAEALERFLSEETGQKVQFYVPKRGDKLRLVETAQANAQTESERIATASQKRLKTLEWLRRTLELESDPMRIEAFDVSNLGNDGIVAAMTVFSSGRPLKRDYRKFRIRDVTGQDDYHSMQEAVRRRFSRYLEDDPKFTVLPDLLLIDGGSVHAGAAAEVLRELGIDLPVFGMVKDDRHRTRALESVSGEEIGLSGNPAVFALIGSIQEETHRYAIAYQRSIRGEKYTSELDDIPGIGKKRRNELLGHFKTIDAIRTATVDDLGGVLPVNAARAVYEHFNK